MKQYGMSKSFLFMKVLIAAGVYAAFLPSLQTKAATLTISPGQSIQQAMDSLKNQGGGTLYLNPGTYVVGYGVKIYNNCTLQGASSTDRPVLKLASGKDEPVVTNASVPFMNVAARNLIIDGGLSASELNYPEYYHKGGDEYNQRIASGAESKESLDAKIEAARLNVLGIDFSDKHSDVQNNGAVVDHVLVRNSSMGINVGRTKGVTILNALVTNNGAVKKYYHGLYLSIVDNVLIDGLEASNTKTGMGLKLTDFYDVNDEASIIIRNSKFNNNYDRGIAVYHMQNIRLERNEALNNQKSGINLVNCKNGYLLNNTAQGNPLVENVSYDIWLNGTTGFTLSGNVYGSKKGF